MPPNPTDYAPAVAPVVLDPLEEFLLRLGKTPRLWAYDYAGRVRSNGMCPVVAVFNAAERSRNRHHDWYRGVMAAADGPAALWPYDPALVPRLLSACGLSQPKGGGL